MTLVCAGGAGAQERGHAARFVGDAAGPVTRARMMLEEGGGKGGRGWGGRGAFKSQTENSAAAPRFSVSFLLNPSDGTRRIKLSAPFSRLAMAADNSNDSYN